MKRQSLLILLLSVIAAACRPATPTPMPTETPVGTPTPQPSPTVAPTARPGVLYVNAAQDLGPISSYLYGSNYGPMHAIPIEMLPYALDARVTALRFPGGAWGDALDLQTFQIDPFLAFCKQMDALPTISVRLKGGVPETAARLVRYTNLDKGYGVVYWSIGNEPTLYEAELHETYDTVRFNQEWRAIAKAMKAVDPTIKLMGPELHQWGTRLATTPKDSAGRDWMTEFLKANGDLVDVVTVHRYPLWRPGDQKPTVQEMRENTKEWPEMVVYLRSLIQLTTGRDLPIAFTEVNSAPSNTSGGEATPDSFYNAIWYADVLGRLGQQGVFMVNQWVISQRESPLGLIYGNEVRPTLYVFYMYKQFGNRQVYAASGIADVTIYAALREDGTLTLMVINLSDKEQRAPLQIQGAALGAANVWRLDAIHSAKDWGQQPLPADGILTLPAESVTLYAIRQ